MISKIVVIGGGYAACSFAAALRQNDFNGSITLLSAETSLPYHRPPLSKAFLLGEAANSDLHLRPPSFYLDNDIDLRRACRAVEIDRRARHVVLENGGCVEYDTLVIAAGARNRPLGIPGETLAGVGGLRSLEDAERLRSGLQRGRKLVIIGAGFVGMEVAAIAGRAGLDVTVVEQASRALVRALSAPMAAFLVARQRERGTRLIFDAGVSAILGDDHGTVAGVSLTRGEILEADLVLVAAGVVACEDIAQQAGLAVSNGIVVDAFLRTTDSSIFAIGDCANFPLAGVLGGRIRLESIQNAGDQARCLADCLTDRRRPYQSIPWFWSDQGDIKLQIAGFALPDDEYLLRGDDSAADRAVMRFRDGRLVALETINMASEHMAARRALAAAPYVELEEFSDPSLPLRSILMRVAAGKSGHSSGREHNIREQR